MREFDLELYRGKRVFVTGHTGFKGTWLCKMLLLAGAEVTGYSLNPPTEPSLFVLSGVRPLWTGKADEQHHRRYPGLFCAEGGF